MKKHVLTVILFLVSFYSIEAQNIDKGNMIISQKNGIKIFLPKIDSMVECYYEPVIYKNYNALGSAKNDSETIAFYLNKKDLDRMIYEDKITHNDESFSLHRAAEGDRKFLATLNNQMLNKLKRDAELFWHSSSMKEIEKNAERLINKESKIDDKLKLKFNTPVLVNNYKLNDDAYTISLLTLIKFNLEDSSVSDYVYEIVSLIHIKHHIYFLYYTISYLDDQRLSNVKARNDYQVFKLLNLNN